jgi:penicillin-binding protein 1C
VTLWQLAEAYRGLANGGEFSPIHLLVGAPRGEPPTAPLSPQAVALVRDILADRDARVGAFGRFNDLEFPFEVAAKTGTSKGYRDNWTVGFSSEVTVAVWVGNFDGSPMTGSSGITGAGPLFHRLMEAAMEGRHDEALRLSHEAGRGALESRRICPLSGLPSGPGCAHSMLEWLPRAEHDDSFCDWHVVDERAFERVGTGAVKERYPDIFVPWALAAGRPLASEPRAAPALSRGARDASSSRASRRISVRSPRKGAAYFIDPNVSLAQQELILEAQAPQTESVTFVLDGAVLSTVGAPHRATWRMRSGEHALTVRSETGQSETVSFSVY